MALALPKVPYRNPLLRVMYFSGGVGTYYGTRVTRNTLCPLARTDPRGFNEVASRQLFTSPADDRLMREAKVTRAQVLQAYRRGVLLACAARR